MGPSFGGMMTLEMIVAAAIFFACFFLLFSEKIHRSIIAAAGATLMTTAGLMLGFYSEEKALHAIDFETVGLLLGMMILVVLLERTGFFRYLAVWAGKLSHGKPAILLILMSTITALLSMFLDNVTTIVLIAPVTILICEILDINAAPILMSEALLSNTGGTATLVGDPPNILIGTAANFSFNDFLLHSLPVILICMFSAVVLLLFLFREELSSPPLYEEIALKLNFNQTIEDKSSVKKVLSSLILAIVLFFLQDKLTISPAFIALSCSALAMIWINPPIEEILQKIEWSVLIFFMGIFVMVGGLESSGILRLLSNMLVKLNFLPPVALGVLLIWIIALLSAFVDNIPITIAMIPVIEGLSKTGLNITPFWWALVFGAGLGGNATIIGSTANIIVASLSDKTRSPITTTMWNKRGLPVMLVTCSIASILYTIFFEWFK
jgi:Na+/H+ antiporter NhaD/arsenite permease-like protein